MPDQAMRVVIDEGRCGGCNLCVRVCGRNFIEVPGGKPKAADPVETCIRCGHCVAVCPSGAVSHSGLGATRFPAVEGRAGLDGLMALLAARRSCRDFTEKEVSRQDLAALLEAAAQAPNGCNKRKVGFNVVTTRSTLKELSKRIGGQMVWLSHRLASPWWRAVFKLVGGSRYRESEPLIPLFKPMTDAIEGGRDMVLYDAPCAILIHTRKADSCGPEDAAYCGANILLAAEALGLGTCVVDFLTEPVNRDQGLARLAGIPPDHRVHTSIIVGHPKFRYARGISRPGPEALVL